MSTSSLERVRRRAVIQFVLGVTQMTGAVLCLGLLLRDGPSATVMVGVLLTGTASLASIFLRRSGSK